MAIIKHVSREIHEMQKYMWGGGNYLNLRVREGSHQEDNFKQETKRQKGLNEVLLFKDKRESVKVELETETEIRMCRVSQTIKDLEIYPKSMQIKQA